MPLIVNAQLIEDALVDNEFSGIKAYHESLGNVSCCERDPEFREQAKRNVVGRVLLAQEAARRMPAAQAGEVDAEIEKLKEQHGQTSFAPLAADPEQMAALRAEVDLHLRIQALLAELEAESPEPSEQDLLDCYARNLTGFTKAERARASHISKNPGRTNQERQQAFDQLREVRRQLLAGADFDEMARQHSDRGHELIDLGFFARGEVTEEFELVAFSMEIGELSPVFASAHGYHIAKLTGREPAAPEAFEQVRDRVIQLLSNQRRQEAAERLVQRLEAVASIEQTETAEPPVQVHVHM